MRPVPLAHPLSALGHFALGLAACSSGSQPSGPTGSIAIATAPIAYPGLGNVCVSIEVENGQQQTVWQKSNVCADDFGDGASRILYIGTCDASAGNQQHTVHLVLEGLFEEDGSPIDDFINPAPANRPVTLPASCAPNADTQVEFNLVVMRQANQGFFDIAVEFDDIFCSAKVDCKYGSAGQWRPIELVHDPVSGERVDSAVIGLACTGGLEADTHLYYSEVLIACPGLPTVSLPLQRAPGRLYPPPAVAPAPLVDALGFVGAERLADSDDKSWGKLYFNLALGLDFDLVSGPCTLSFTATASTGPLDACVTPAATTYPVIQVSMPFVNQAGTDFACTQHPLDQIGATGVHTSYTPTDAPATFATFAHAGGGGVLIESCAVCGDGAVQAGEVCDGASVPSCVELGFVGGTTTCVGCAMVDTSACLTCGNDVIDASETCDGTATATCAELGFTYGATSCTSCTLDASACTNAICGNGVIDPGEGCDTDPGGAMACPYGQTSCTVCDASCQLVAGTVIGWCGDGVTQAGHGEVCDGAATPTCQSLGFAGGTTSCQSCTSVDTSNCVSAVCGNGVIEAGEACDGSNRPTCQSLGFAFGATACEDCELDISDCATTLCGNGTVDSGEDCDPPTQVTCDYGDASCQQCSNTCRLEPGRLTGVCGDGVKQTNEACDGNANGSTCASAGFVWGTIGCNADCTVDTSGCSNTTDPCAGQPTTYAGTIDIGDGYALPDGVDLQCLALVSSGNINLRGPYTTFSHPLLPRLRVTQGFAYINVYEWPTIHPFPTIAQLSTLWIQAPLNNTHIALTSITSSQNFAIWFSESTTNFRLTMSGPGPTTVLMMAPQTGFQLDFPGVTTFGGTITLDGTGAINAPAMAPTSLASLTLLDGPFTGLSRVTEVAGLTCLGQSDLVNLNRVTQNANVYPSCATPLGSGLPALARVEGLLQLKADGPPGEVRLPVLTHAGGVTAGASATPSVDTTGLTGFVLPMLGEIAGNLRIESLDDLATLTFPSLWRVAGLFRVTNNPDLSTCAIKAIRQQLTSGPTSTTITGNLADCTYP